jgi:hypothetical protein
MSGKIKQDAAPSSRHRDEIRVIWNAFDWQGVEFCDAPCSKHGLGDRKSKGIVACRSAKLERARRKSLVKSTVDFSERELPDTVFNSLESAGVQRRLGNSWARIKVSRQKSI